MKKYLNEEDRINEITNGLWLKFFAANLSSTISHYLDNIDNNYHDYMSIEVMSYVCDDILSDDKSNIPNYIYDLHIDLEASLEILIYDKILTEEEAELLYNDYKSLAGEPQQGD